MKVTFNQITEFVIDDDFYIKHQDAILALFENQMPYSRFDDMRKGNLVQVFKVSNDAKYQESREVAMACLMLMTEAAE